MVEHLDAHADIERSHRQNGKTLQSPRILGRLPKSVKIQSIGSEECNGNAHEKDHNPIAALDDAHQLLPILLCIGNGNLRIKHTDNRPHQAGDGSRHLGSQCQKRHGRISVRNQRT